MTFELSGIFGAGLLTFLSPCILPLVPLYLSLLGGVSVAELRAGRRPRGRLVAAALAFSLGLSAVFVALGLAASSLGHALVAHRTLLLQLGGLVVFLFGLKFIGVLKVPFLERDARPWLSKLGGTGGVLGAFAFGAAFALGWTPCIGPVLGSVLTFTASSASSPAAGALYLGAYAAGLSLPLIAAALVAPWALALVERLRAKTRAFEVATGVALAAMGLLLITDNLDAVTPAFGGPVAAKVAPAVAAPSQVQAYLDSPSAPAAASGACTEPLEGEGAGCAIASEEIASVDFAAGPAQLPQGQALVEFVSRSCPVCQRMAPVVAAAEHDCAGKGVDVKRVDVSEPAGAALARSLNVRGVPTFVFSDEGREVARLIGEQPLSALTQALEVLSGEKCDGFRALPPAPRAPRPADLG